MKYLTGTSRTIFFYCIVFFLLTSLHFTFAQDKKSQNAKLEINKLTLFKNGLGFVVSTTELPGNAESIKIGQLPVPTFGTFWVSYPKEVKMHNLVTTMEKNEKEYPIQSLGRMLLLNTGRKVIIHTSDKDYEGIVLSKSYEDETPQTPNPYYMGYKKTNDPSVWGPAYDDKVISIKTEKGVVAVSSVNIYRVEFLDDNPVSTTKSIEKSPSIIMQLDKPAGGEKITVSYLAHGITWSPSYLIDLSDPKTAKFSAHAMIINEMTDLNNIKLQLTTGFPNIKFGNVLNPIAKSQSLAEFLNALGGSTSRYGSDRGIMSQQIML